ncbi:MAG: hypothetical protein J6Z01_00010 [Bacteroidales bacterium]|nr:hypothetical protein [Bacteroidales bacterium]
MKKYFFLGCLTFLSLITTTNVCFAGNSRNGDDGLAIFLYIVFGIIGICLLVKIWGMTNDVKSIKSEVLELRREVVKIKNIHRDDGVPNVLSKEMVKNLRFNALLGNVEYVKRQLLDNFCAEVDKQIYDKTGKTDDSKLSNSIRPYVEMLEKQFNRIGETLPDYVKKMNTFSDYVNIVSLTDDKVSSEA